MLFKGFSSLSTHRYTAGEQGYSHWGEVLDYAGIRASELPARQQRQMIELAGVYIGNMGEGRAKVKMNEVKRHLDATYFAWIGGTDAASVFYDRIHSPVVLIEFDHQRPSHCVV